MIDWEKVESGLLIKLINGEEFLTDNSTLNYDLEEECYEIGESETTATTRLKFDKKEVIGYVRIPRTSILFMIRFDREKVDKDYINWQNKLRKIG